MSGSKIGGADDLARALQTLGRSIGAPINAASRKALRPMLAAAKRNAPVDKGNLKKSLTIKADDKASKARPRFVVGPDASYQIGNDRPVKYAHVVEFGPADGSRPGARFMSSAFEETADQTIKILGDEIGPQIEKAAARKIARKAAK